MNVAKLIDFCVRLELKPGDIRNLSYLEKSLVIELTDHYRGLDLQFQTLERFDCSSVVEYCMAFAKKAFTSDNTTQKARRTISDRRRKS